MIRPSLLHDILTRNGCWNGEGLLCQARIMRGRVLFIYPRLSRQWRSLLSPRICQWNAVCGLQRFSVLELSPYIYAVYCQETRLIEAGNESVLILIPVVPEWSARWHRRKQKLRKTNCDGIILYVTTKRKQNILYISNCFSQGLLQC